MKAETKQKNVSVNINDGAAFFAHETHIVFSPYQFIFDFKSLSPRMDPRVTDEQAIISLVHNVVMIDPFHASQLLMALQASVKNYENQFGKIEKPKALERFEKDNKALLKSLSNTNTNQDVPGYFG